MTGISVRRWLMVPAGAGRECRAGGQRISDSPLPASIISFGGSYER
ncbi:hypothetical protein SFOMI_3233 [Sphingobium fuliginis]|uniref:Uncharacterized protein n=1 Tax=Sphingobium fuliginis (strain ATCC 27551) TaxID=336203 RepID=A0A292ZDA2_SPHSA|nr:hypothetical protein SFOMI_3233 [Sphingobium fuliginis]